MPIVSKIVPEFINFVKSTTLEINNKSIFNEVELTFFKPPLICFSNVNFYASKLPMEKKTYFTVTKSTTTEKYRQYIPFEKFKYYHMENRDIKGYLNSDWEVKKRVKDVSYHDNILFSHALEYSKRDNITHISDNSKIYSLSFSREINLYTSQLKLNIRLTEKLGNLLSNKRELLNRQKMNVYFEKPYIIKAEIELRNPLKIDYDKLQDELNKVLIILFGYKELNKISIYSDIKDPVSEISTIVEKHKIAISKYDLNDIVLTPKKDGEPVFFKIDRGMIEIHFKDKFNILATVNIDKEYLIEGNGEYLDKKIYIFEILKIMKGDTILEFKDKRLESLKFTESLYTTDESDITMSENLYIDTFTDYIDLVNNINTILNNKYVYLTDGAILFNKYKTEKAVDYKLKNDNTVDLLFYLDVINGIILFNNNFQSLKFKVYVYNSGTRVFQEVDTVIVKVSDRFFYDVDLNMLVFDKYKIVPIKFIGEYSFISEEPLTKIRLDKTDRFISGYKGNSYATYKNSESFYDGNNNIISNKMIEDINNNISEYPSDKTLLDKIFSEIKTFYYTEEKTVTIILSMVSNFIKTNEISFCLNSGINSKLFYKVLDIDAGKGGDINKLFFMNVKYVTATDPDSKALSIYEERHSNLGKQNVKTKAFSLKTVVTSIIDDKFLKIKDVFDAINYQFAIHFYWEDAYKRLLVERLSKLVKIGAPVLITTNNGNKIKEFMTNRNEYTKIINTKKNIIFRIEQDNDMKRDNKIRIFYQSSNKEKGTVENMVFRNDIIKVFSEFNFLLHDYYSFDKILEPDFKKLITSIKETNKTKKSANDMFRNIYNLYDEEVRNDNDIKDLLSCFCVYRFYYKI